jgi:hypothetical protein
MRPTPRPDVTEGDQDDAVAAPVRRAHCGSEGALIAAHWPVTDELPSPAAREPAPVQGERLPVEPIPEIFEILFAMD